MSQEPEIKPVVNREAEAKRDKKKAGVLVRLFGGGGSFWFGGASDGLGIFTSGGLLATKAGLTALILVGTTVAGGIGMLGYRLFGPGSDAVSIGDNLQLFAPKPKAAQSADVAPKDGSSTSLQYLNRANRVPVDDAAANAAAKDSRAGASAGSNGAMAGAGNPINKAGDAGSGANKDLMKNTAKFGALSTAGGGGGGGAVANSASAKNAGDTSASKGSLSGFKKTGAAAASGGSARSIAGRRFSGVVGQGFGVLHDNQGARSSYAAGQTYDGAATGGSNIGAGGSPIGASPGVESAAGTQAKTTAATAANTKTSDVPTPSATEEAPWQNSIKVAEGLLAAGGVLLYMMSKLGKTNPIIYYALNALVGLIAAAIIAIGAQISGGQYGQKLQGEVLAAAGAGLVLGAAMAAVQGPSSAAKGASGGIAGINPYVLLGGGAAAVGLAASMMLPVKKYPSSDFSNGNAPDSHWFGYRQPATEAALNKRVA